MSNRTGYPSLDKPWLKYYTVNNSDIPTGTIYSCLCESNKDNLLIQVCSKVN